jgi:YidC/Oxa1 family membrane protein insertase
MSLLNGPIDLGYHLVLSLAHVLTPLTGGLATAAAIVLFTMGVRLLLMPLSFYGMRGQARMAGLQPRVEELRRRYARQPEKLQAELGTLYAQEAGGMMAGCLPLLLQLPFFSIMYRLFLSGKVAGHANALLSRDLFGTPLGSHLLSAASLTVGHVLVFAGLLALLMLVATLSVRLVRSSAPAGPQLPGAMGALTRLLPYTTVIIAVFVPLAAGLYLLTTTTWTVAERALLRRRALAPATGGGAVSPAGSAR